MNSPITALGSSPTGSRSAKAEKIGAAPGSDAEAAAAPVRPGSVEDSGATTSEGGLKSCAPPTGNSEEFCPDPALERLMVDLDAAERSLSQQMPGEVGPRCRRYEPRDLQNSPRLKGSIGNIEVGSGLMGDSDLDGDGRPDVVLQYTSVDFWRHIWFARGATCLRYVGFVDAYQIELTSNRHHGIRDLRAYSFPVMGEIQLYQYTGTQFRRVSRPSKVGP